MIDKLLRDAHGLSEFLWSAVWLTPFGQTLGSGLHALETTAESHSSAPNPVVFPRWHFFLVSKEACVFAHSSLLVSDRKS
jgi:hypothetical protein